MSESEQVMGRFWGLSAPRELWMALGATSVDARGTVDFGPMHRDKNTAYAVELIERAQAQCKTHPSDREVLRKALVLYAEDRGVRALSKLAAAIGNLNRLEISVPQIAEVARLLSDRP